MKIKLEHEDKSCVYNFLGNREHQNRKKKNTFMEQVNSVGGLSTDQA